MLLRHLTLDLISIHCRDRYCPPPACRRTEEGVFRDIKDIVVSTPSVILAALDCGMDY